MLAQVLPVSFFERGNNAFFNSILVFDADGKRLGLYRKSHIPDGPGYQVSCTLLRTLPYRTVTSVVAGHVVGRCEQQLAVLRLLYAGCGERESCTNRTCRQGGTTDPVFVYVRLSMCGPYMERVACSCEVTLVARKGLLYAFTDW